ncbi:MAG: energy-coupling factor transporter transmembrane component T [Candidatus Bipolaricaulota bacterium]
MGLHGTSPLANVFLLLCLVGATLAAPSLAAAGVVLTAMAALAVASGERPLSLLPRLRRLLVFAFVLFLAQALSTRGGTALVTWPVRITDAGMIAGGRMAVRFLTILSASALFVRTTDPDRLSQALVRLGIPYRFGALLVLSLRFVPFFEDELRSVREAQKIRGLAASVRSPRRLLQSARYTFLPVLVSGLYRVDAITISMKTRGFGLYPDRTTARPMHRSPWTILTLFVAALALAAALAIETRGWG